MVLFGMLTFDTVAKVERQSKVSIVRCSAKCSKRFRSTIDYGISIRPDLNSRYEVRITNVGLFRRL